MYKRIFVDTTRMQYYRDSPNNYCHFVLGNLLETFIALRNLNLIPTNCSIVTNNPTSQFLDFYSVFSDGQPTIGFPEPTDQIVMPIPRTNWRDGNDILSLYYVPMFIEFIKAALHIENGPGNTITYIRRPMGILSRRGILNEGDLIEKLAFISETKGLQFEALDLSGVSFCNQIRLMSKTRLLVGIHGAGILNSIFCHKGTIVMEIRTHSKFKHEKFKLLCDVCGVEHRIVTSHLVSMPSFYNIIDLIKRRFRIENRFFRDRFIFADVNNIGQLAEQSISA